MRRPRVPILVVLPLLLATWGCADKDGAAQTPDSASVVPSDIQVIEQRADRARVEGDSAAPLRIIEVSDFECPYCKEYFENTYPKIDSAYIQTGKVQYVWVSFPNPGHTRAWPAIEAGFCAGAVGKFWPMHDLLFKHQDDWKDAAEPVNLFVGYADQLGIDTASYRECLLQDRTAPLQVRDLVSVSRVGVNGTPFFVIGDSVSLQGAAPFDRFKTVIDSLLKRRATAGKTGAAGGKSGSTGGAAKSGAAGKAGKVPGRGSAKKG